MSVLLLFPSLDFLQHALGHSAYNKYLQKTVDILQLDQQHVSHKCSTLSCSSEPAVIFQLTAMEDVFREIDLDEDGEVTIDEALTHLVGGNVTGLWGLHRNPFFRALSRPHSTGM